MRQDPTNNVIQKHGGLGDNVAGNKIINNHVQIYEVPQQLTTTLGEFPNFKGRRKDCIKLTKELNEHKAVVVHGIGGIGKSSFVSAYLNTHKNEFKYYGFINWTDDIKLNFFNSLQVNMKLKDYNDIDKNFDETMRKLRDLDGQKLLIIDRIEEKEISYREEEKSIIDILTLIDNDYKIIFTSRFKIKTLTSYSLNPLDKEDAKEIFLTHYKKSNEIEKIYEILKYLDYHPLFVKLVAETLKVTNFRIDTIIQKFNKGELSKIKFIDEYTMDTTSFNKNLKTLFNMQKINEDGLLLLKQFSALPSIGIEFTFLQKILYKDELLKNRLNVLVAHGWLISDNKSYKLHQIIKEYILLEKQPLYVEIEMIFEYFSKLLENSADINVATSNRENLIFFDSLYKVLKKYDYFTIAQFYMDLGNIYRYLGIYKKALFFGKLSIKVLNSKTSIINEEKFKNLLIYKSTFYNNLSQTYYLLGFYKRVFVLDKKTLTLRKEIFGEKHISTIQSYHNLAQLNFSCGNIEEAKNIFEKAIILIDELKEIENRDMYINEKTALYSNYAIFLSKTQPKNKLAITFAEKAVRIYKNEYKKANSTLATFYFHLATIYEGFGQNIEAKKLYENVLQIKIDIVGEEHNDVATAYMGLAFSYIKLNNKNCSKSIEYINNALEIYKKIYLTEKHPDIALGYDNLGSLYNQCKDYSKFNEFSLKALDIHIYFFGEAHYRTLQIYLNVIISHYKLKEYIEALTYINKIIELKPICLDEFDTEIIISLVEIIPSNDKVGETVIREIGEIINRIKIL